ncbi:MAG TPA: Hsp70 family protein [Methylococcus sp.]|nr:Hsp70 family protein [Methylococcus sp.]
MRGSSQEPRFIVGIDLGTTHTVVAYADRSGSGPIELFPIEQLVAPGQLAACPLLPSVRYHPAAGELAATDTALPWAVPEIAPGCRPVIGEWARQLGSRSRGRLVVSAKSWLCHAGVDRTAPILPWGAPEEVPRVSPLDATADFLWYVRQAWQRRFPEDALEEQDLVVTIPASFDDVARTLTVEAAKIAGLPAIRLVEEPQAACYDFLWTHRRRLRDSIEGVRLLLVCDVGGGTTDLTLIRVEMGDSEPRLERIAVGSHLLLGGDNIDLALARRLEPRLTGGEDGLSAAELHQLAEQCRIAKERFLAEEGPDVLTITLFGAGSALLANARSVELTRGEVVETVLDGFFPLVAPDAKPQRRSGVVEFGLPYAADPAITRHVAAFLSQHRGEIRACLGDAAPAVPDALLLNGGVFRSPSISRRMVEVLGTWAGRAPVLLRNDRPDQAVAYGAVAYGLARRGVAVQRIRSGSARSYYLLVEDDRAGHRRGLCLLPRGVVEGQELLFEQRKFLLRLGQPVRFHLFSSTCDAGHAAGDLVTLEGPEFEELPPLAVALRHEELGKATEVEVRLAAVLTEIGTIRLQCLATSDPSRRWDLELQVRRGAVPGVRREGSDPKLIEAESLIRRVFGKKDKQLGLGEIKTLRADLEKLLGRREDWDTPLCRELFAALWQGAAHRRRSAHHERLWLSLTGYCLRPGFGAPLDDWRVEQVGKLYPQGPQFVNEVRNWAEWWTFWRRIAGGLSAEEQRRIFEDLVPFLDPVRAKRENREALARKRGFLDMLRLAASLERLSPAEKAVLGGWLLQRLAKDPDAAELWWALGRVGARAPFHGSAHNVVTRDVVAGWVEQALQHDWKKQGFIGFAATLMARLTGDRERDLEPGLRERVATKLMAARLPESWSRLVSEVQQLEQTDENRIFGEGLPPGLKLLG